MVESTVRRLKYLVGGALTALVLAAEAAPAIEALALMRDRAILRIDGRQHTLRPGESQSGVRLVSADPRQAVLEIEGRRHTIGLSGRIAGSFAERDKREITINRNALHQYRTRIEINGRSMLALVDTGANVVAMSGDQAARLGIDFQRIGAPGQVRTAAGVRNSWTVKLDSVAVGDIKVPFVVASVIEGSYPEDVLLGMSWLQHVHLREANGIMHLTEK